MKRIVMQVVCMSLIVMCAVQGYAEEALQPMTIQLYWVPNVQFAGVLVAKERGWYEEAGIDLTVKGWENGISSVQEVMSGNAQIGVGEGAEIITSRVNGLTIQAIGVQFQQSPFCLMSKKSLGIEQPEDLRGKRIGINNTDSELVTRVVLANQGLQFEDITPVQAQWDLQPLIDDEFDVYLAFMNNEPLTMKELGYDVTYLPAFKYGYTFYSSVYFVTDAMIQEQPELVQAFLEATLRGWQEAFNNPAAAAQMIVEKYYPDGSVQQQAKSLKMFQMLATLGEGKKFLGWMEEKTWAKGIDILYEFGQIEQKIPANDVFTAEFLRNIYFGEQK